jgi:hypothetical protein
MPPDIFSGGGSARIPHAYLLAALLLCAVEFIAVHGRLTLPYLVQIGARYAAAVLLAWMTAFALWPWLQIGNPLHQFHIALEHFATIPMAYEFSHWGERIWTNDLPVSYIPGQLLARLPEGFLFLLAVAGVYAIAAVLVLARAALASRRRERGDPWQIATRTVARRRELLIVCLAVILPISFLIIQRATLYDGIRHVLFVIPMLAILAGFGFWALLPLLRRAPVIAAVGVGAYVGGLVGALAALHPVEYVAMNALAGGTRGAYGKFELDYGSTAATEGLRRLERKLDYDPAVRATDNPPSILICIPWREQLVKPMLRRPWIVETDPDQADFIIATERARCADNQSVVLIEEVKRFDSTFAWVYARRAGDL